MTCRLTYRPEVNGLRSIAVLPVILFHAGLGPFTGGFVGVDVFFVISGYLITGILLVDLNENRFSLVRFYERRARRILPALFVVMLACLPFAWVWMLPSEMLDLAQSMVAVSLFASNILFYLQAGYFAPNSELLPLLHTWSLAVEEQFYIIFPVLLFGLWRFGAKATFGVLAVLALVSLLLCHLFVIPNPDATFYLLHTRAWELLAGSLVALWQMRGGTQRQDASDIAAATGLVLILASIFLFDHETPFPSLWATIPVGGTVLILLFADTRTITARLLATGPLVGIGLISYSAYLIHQPLFAFARISSLTAPSPGLMLGLAILTLPLAWFSWRFVEQPFRGTGTFSRRGVFVASGLGLATFIGLGLAGQVTQGMPQRLPADVLRLAAGQDDQNPRKRQCHRLGRNETEHPLLRCMDDGSPMIALIGDSHADALAAGLHDMLVADGYGVYESTSRGCWPITGLQRLNDTNGNCDRYNRQTYDYLQGAGIDLVVMTARWTLPVVGTVFDNREGGLEVDPIAATNDRIDRTGPFGAVDDPARQQRVLDAVEAQIRDVLKDHKLLLVYPIPEAGWNVPLTAARQALRLRRTPQLDTSFARYQDRNAAIIALFDSIDHPNLYRFDPAGTLCNATKPGRCDNIRDGRALYYDDDHLSRFGATLVSKDLMEAIAAIPLPDPQP